MIRIFLLSPLACLLFFHGFAQPYTPKSNHPLFESSSSLRSGAFIYDLITSMEPYTDLSGATSLNNGEIWDEPDYSFPIPFPFMLNGENIPGLTFFGSGSLMIAPSGVPDVDKLLFPFETDLVDRGAIEGIASESPISYLVEGAVGSRILKLEFNNAGSYYEMEETGTTNMFINFQMWLHEGSNKIEFRFGPSSIGNAVVFYGGESGAYSGLTDINLIDDITYDPHFISGTAGSPDLSTLALPLAGTPAEGTVYTLFINLPLEIEVTGQNSTSSCEPNGTATAGVTGGLEPYTYSWNNTITTQTITGLDAGTYTVTVTDDNGATATGSVTISGVDPLEANASATDETSPGLNDGTATSSPIGGTMPYAYVWSNGETTATITGLSPGIYRVTVTDESGCTDWEQVIVNPAGCATLTVETSITQISCYGACDGSIQILEVNGGLPPYNFSWAPSGEVTQSIINLCPNDYTVTVTDSDGCFVVETYSIVEPEELLANAAAASETSAGANDGSAWAVPTGGNGPYAYLWSNGSTDSLITNLSPGDYTVTVTDDVMCADTQTVTVTSFSCGILDVVLINNTCYQSCDGSIAPIVFNMVEPVSYTWSNGDTTATIDGLCVGDYSFMATDAVGCVVTATYSITSPDELIALLNSTNETMQDANDGTAWAIPTGGIAPYTYLWSTGSTDSLITNLPPSLYFVILTDAAGCADTQVVFVLEFPCLGGVTPLSVNASCFGLCDGIASIALSGGTGPIDYNWNTGDTTMIVAGLCAGIYNVTVTDAGQGCTYTQSIGIDEPNPLILIVDEVLDVTDTTNSAISISVSGGTPPYTYAWSGPGGTTYTAEDLNSILPGLYTIVVTDTMGCTVTVDSIEVEDLTVGVTNPERLVVMIYPNPAYHEITIDMQDAEEFEIQLSTIDGRLLKSWSNKTSLDVSSFSEGNYMLRISSGKRFMVHRLVIMR